LPDGNNITFKIDGSSNARQIPCGSFVNWIDSSSSELHTGTLRYQFLNNYVLATFDINDWNTYLTHKDPSGKENEDEIWLDIPIETKLAADAKLLQNQLTECVFNLPIKQIDILADSNSENSIGMFSQIVTDEVSPSLDTTIFGTDPLLGSMIALLVVVLIIGVIISILYRIPGLIAYVMMLLSMSLVFFALMYSGYAISVTLIFGLLVGLISGMFIMISIFERAKKFLKRGSPIDVSLIKAFKNGSLMAIDINAIMLLIGLSFIYFGAFDLVAFGVTISLYAIISFVLVFLGS